MQFKTFTPRSDNSLVAFKAVDAADQAALNAAMTSQSVTGYIVELRDGRMATSASWAPKVAAALEARGWTQ